MQKPLLPQRGAALTEAALLLSLIAAIGISVYSATGHTVGCTLVAGGRKIIAPGGAPGSGAGLFQGEPVYCKITGDNCTNAMLSGQGAGGTTTNEHTDAIPQGSGG